MSDDHRILQFVTNLKSARKRQGLSQQALAERSGINRTHMNDIERRKYAPTLKTALRLADALGMPIGELIA